MRVDSSRFPLVVVHWDGAISDEELTAFFRTMDALVARAARSGRHYAIVSDGDADFRPSQRKLIAAWVAEHPPELAAWDLGSYVVLRSAAARGALTALRWLTPKLQKVYVYENIEQAVRAASERLNEAAGKPRIRRSHPS